MGDDEENSARKMMAYAAEFTQPLYVHKTNGCGHLFAVTSENALEGSLEGATSPAFIDAFFSTTTGVKSCPSPAVIISTVVLAFSWPVEKWCKGRVRPFRARTRTRACSI